MTYSVTVPKVGPVRLGTEGEGTGEGEVWRPRGESVQAASGARGRSQGLGEACPCLAWELAHRPGCAVAVG